MHCLPLQYPLSTGRCILRPDHQQRAHLTQEVVLPQLGGLGGELYRNSSSQLLRGGKKHSWLRWPSLALHWDRGRTLTPSGPVKMQMEMLFLTASWSLPRSTPNKSEQAAGEQACQDRDLTPTCNVEVSLEILH